MNGIAFSSHPVLTVYQPGNSSSRHLNYSHYDLAPPNFSTQEKISTVSKPRGLWSLFINYLRQSSAEVLNPPWINYSRILPSFGNDIEQLGHFYGVTHAGYAGVSKHVVSKDKR